MLRSVGHGKGLSNMYKGFYNLTSAMLTQGRMLDVISNNMTNVATHGFKADRYTMSTFDQHVWSLVGNKNKVYTELGEQSFITAPSQLYTDFSQASFDETGQPLDFAIEGRGYFAVETDEGRIYTRNGNFSLDDEGYLCLPGRGRVLDPDGEPILLVTDKIRDDGYGGLFTENGGFLGRVGVFAFEDEEAMLEKNDRALFVSDAQPEVTLVTVHNGMLERANVDLVQQMMEMIASQRAYQSAAEVIKIYDELINKVTTNVGALT